MRSTLLSTIMLSSPTRLSASSAARTAVCTRQWHNPSHACNSHFRHPTRGKLANLRRQLIRCDIQRGQDVRHLHTMSETDKPAVVLIGWLGAKEQHFAKYIDLWQKLGYKTMGYRPTTSSILVPPIGSRKAVSFINDVQQFQKSHSHPELIYHIFSNAGFLFFGTVLRAIAECDARWLHSLQHNSQPLSQHSMLQPVRGIIFDSAPCRLTPDISARGFTAAVLSKPAASISQQHPRLIAAAQAAFTPILKLPIIANRQDQIWSAWESVAPVSPQLYLYSSADALIPPEEVQKFQKLQAGRGIDIHSKMWTDSAHCEHYRVHPDEYIMELKTFAKSLQG